MAKPRFYITTAIDYPNAKPHIGHAYEKVVADCIARWHTIRGDDVFFLTGTDEHGQKIEKAAHAAKKTPQQFVDAMVEHFKAMDTALDVKYSRFLRTTDKDHCAGAQHLFQRAVDKGDIYLSQYDGLYCAGCESFKLEKDLIDGKCPDHNTPPERVIEESYFFRMSKYAADLKKHIQQHPHFILPASRQREILNRLDEPLKDLSVSRKSLKWGVPLPNDTAHVMYVWFDALSNYINGIGYPKGHDFKKYWPADVHIIGKDISWFHTVIWPTILMSCGLDLPTTVHCHGHLTVNGQKMSKSLGNVIDPVHVANTYGVDAVRYHFIRDVVAGEDGDFNEAALIERANADLADGLGNLLQRTVVLIEKHFASKIPAPAAFDAAEDALIKDANALADEMDRSMRAYEWHHAAEKLFAFVQHCNKYVSDAEPWKHTDDKKRLASILYTLAESLRIASILAWPIIPSMAERLSQQLGQKIGTIKDATFRKSTSGIVQRGVLFRKIETQAPPPAPASKETHPLGKLNLKVGIITDIQPHPNADKLYVLSIDLGTQRRQLVAGLKAHYAPEELLGKRIIVVTNLKPAKLRGVESQGMLLAADKGGAVRVLEAPKSPAGAQVFAEGIAPGEGTIEIDDVLKARLTTKDHHVLAEGKTLKTAAEPIHALVEDGATIR